MKLRLSMHRIIFIFLLIACLVTTVACHNFSFTAYNYSAKYQDVKELLKVGNWKEANLELIEIALDVTGRDKEGWFDEAAIKNFPCAHLVYIDRLMTKYSNGKFGFTAQKEVYAQQASTGNETETFLKFADAVGWRKNNQWLPYNQLDFSLNAPKGGLLVNMPKSGLRPPFKTRQGNPDRPHNFAMIMERVKICTP